MDLQIDPGRMDPVAARHVAEFLREQLEAGADVVAAEREVLVLEAGEGDELDGREVAAVRLLVDGGQIIALEHVLVEDGVSYIQGLAAELQRAGEESAEQLAAGIVPQGLAS